MRFVNETLRYLTWKKRNTFDPLRLLLMTAVRSASQSALSSIQRICWPFPDCFCVSRWKTVFSRTSEFLQARLHPYAAPTEREREWWNPSEDLLFLCHLLSDGHESILPFNEELQSNPIRRSHWERNMDHWQSGSSSFVLQLHVCLSSTFMCSRWRECVSKTSVNSNVTF